MEIPRVPHVVDVKADLDRGSMLSREHWREYSRGREWLARNAGEFELAVHWQQLADHCEEAS